MILECALNTPRKYFSPITVFIIVIFFYGNPSEFTNDALASSSSTESLVRDDLLYEANHNVPSAIKSRSQSYVLRGYNNTGYSVLFKGLTTVIALIGISLMIAKCVRSIQSDSGKKFIRRLSNGAGGCPPGGAQVDPAPPPLGEALQFLNRNMEFTYIELFNTGREHPESQDIILQRVKERAEEWQRNLLDQARQLLNREEDDTLTPQAQNRVKRRRLEIYDNQFITNITSANPILLQMAALEAERIISNSPEPYPSDLQNLRATLLALNGTVQCDLSDPAAAAIVKDLKAKNSAALTPDDKIFSRLLSTTLQGIAQFNNRMHVHVVALNQAMIELGKTDMEIYQDIQRTTGEP